MEHPSPSDDAKKPASGIQSRPTAMGLSSQGSQTSNGDRNTAAPFLQDLRKDTMVAKTMELQQMQRDVAGLREELRKSQQLVEQRDYQMRWMEHQNQLQQDRQQREIRTLVRQSQSSLRNPYNDGNQGSPLDNVCFAIGAAITDCVDSSSSGSRDNQSTQQRPSRGLHTGWTSVHVMHLVVIGIICTHCMTYIINRTTQPPMTAHHSAEMSNSYQYDTPNYYVPPEVSPWDSTPPKPIALFSVDDPVTQQRHTCIAHVRQRQQDTLGPYLNQSNPNMAPSKYLLVDPAYHANVGDHMLTLGTLIFMEQVMKEEEQPVQCYYCQANNFYPDCDETIEASPKPAVSGTFKRALWQAGGNWGDLWRDAQYPRMKSFEVLLKNDFNVIGMPQSLYYKDTSLETIDSETIKARIASGLRLGYDADVDSPENQALFKSRVILSWREFESYEKANALYPWATNLIVPDLGFQLGPFNPIRNNPSLEVDIVVFLRQDYESQVERSENAIREALSKHGKTETTFRLVEWSDQIELFGGVGDFYFNNHTVELLSLGKIVVCDRLHASLLAYLTGLPFIYIDQVSGKITKALKVAFSEMAECQDGESGKWGKADSLNNAIAMGLEFIDKYEL